MLSAQHAYPSKERLMVRRLPTLGLILAVALALAGTTAAAPPAGFSDTPVAPVASPTALAFTPDGRLLITSQTGQLRVFENSTLTTALDLGPGGLNVLQGKILRITRDGGIPPDNPWTGADSARCNVNGHTDTTKKCQEVFARGLRNPFRFAFDPTAAGTRFFINDVGESTWEEIDEGQAGADYGWAVREGFCAEGSPSSCGPPPAGMTNPIYAYGRGGGCGAITGGAFVPNGVWPVEFDGAYMYGDYVCHRIFTLTRPGGSYTSAEFSPDAGTVTAMAFGPHGSTQALYYTTLSNGGQVRKIAYTGSANPAPSAAARANPTSRPAPPAGSLRGARSRHPHGGPPAPEDLPATTTSYLEVFLSATDSHGLTRVITRELRPHLVDVTFATDPPGLEVTANNNPIAGPRTVVSWEGFVLELAAPDQQDSLGQTWLFDHWSDGGAATHTITTPATAATYTATFRPKAGTKYIRFMPLIKK